MLSFSEIRVLIPNSLVLYRVREIYDLFPKQFDAVVSCEDISGAAPASPERVKPVSTARTDAAAQSVNSAASGVSTVASHVSVFVLSEC